MPPHTQAWRVARSTGCRYTDARIAINLLVNRADMAPDDAADRVEKWARDELSVVHEARAFLESPERIA